MWQQIFLSSLCVLFYILFKNLDNKQNKVKYYSKVFVVYFYVLMVTTLACPFIIFKKRDTRNSMIIIQWVKLVGSMYGMNWEIQNEEHLAIEGGAVIVSNHQSSMDAIGVFCAWEKINKIVAVVKKELWCLGVMALAAYKCGTVFIDRRNPRNAYNTLETMTTILKTDGTKIWMFPEGTRNTGSSVKLLPFKKGAFAMAVAAQVPIIPVVFSPQYFINEKKCILYNNGKVIMRCLEPVPTKGLTSDDIPVLQESLHKIVLKAFEKLSKEILNNLPLDTPLATEILF